MVDADRSDRSPVFPETDPTGPGRWLSGHIWWIFLATGIGFLIGGLATFGKSPESPITLARIAGIAFIVDGALVCLLGGWTPEFRGFYLLGAFTGVAGVALLIFFEQREPFRLALVLSGVLVLRGVVDSLVGWGAITEVTDRSRAFWDWILLAVGIINVLLGLLALATKGGSTFVLLAIVGSLAVARGIGMLAVSSRLRVLS
ncbi:MAG TPA: hypothetical protein VHV50_08160 [Actinomycetota bacterium]|nr:hypothetical protein [Actinomycetota bacterium]